MKEQTVKENYIYRNLKPKTTYTINIIARNAETNAYSSNNRKITTTSINKPDLTGFNTEEKDGSGNKLPVTLCRI